MSPMQAQREGFGGPRLVAATALGMAALCASLLAAHGDGEDGLAQELGERVRYAAAPAGAGDARPS